MHKYIIKVCFTAAVAICQINSALGQGIEFGLFLGASNYFGDLSHNTVVLTETHPSAALIGRMNINERWAVKGFVGYGKISGSDVNASSAEFRRRNLSFYSDVYEVSTHFEYNLIRNSVRYSSKRKTIPYLFVGIGLFNFNPKTVFQGKEYELQPLGTEGQGTTQYNDKVKYSLTQFSFPMGFGLKKKVSKHFSIGFEFGARYTQTNYLDDVGGTYVDYLTVERSYGEVAGKLSDRSGELTADGIGLYRTGDKRSNKSINIYDIYMMGGITITYIFPNAGIRCPRF